jgi:hypothetical protein
MRPLLCEVPTLPLSSGCAVIMLLPVLGALSQHYFLLSMHCCDASSYSGLTVTMLVPVLGSPLCYSLVV